MWVHRPERVSGCMPSRFPAWDTSWQGNPPVSTSTGSTCVQSAFVMSPRLGTPGQWWVRMRDGAASISQCQATGMPNTSAAAMSSPP